jgi:hypothetical protein
VQVVLSEEPARPPEVSRLPPPDPIILSTVEWRVIPAGEPVVLEEPMFALTAEGYEALSFNFAEVLRWVREARAQLLHYRGERPLVPESPSE